MRADRLLAELNLLRARGRMTAAELAVELEVTERTIYRDMYALQVGGVPLVAEKGRSGGYSLYRDWRTDITGLTERELDSVLTALALSPDRRAGSTAVTAVAKLAATLPQARVDELGRLRRRVHVEPADSTDAVSAALIGAIRQERAVNLTLRRLLVRQIERLAHPIGLVFAGRDRYLVWHGGDRKARVDDLEAIIDVTVSGEPLIDVDPVDLGRIWQQWTELRREFGHKYLAHLRMSTDVLDHWRQRHTVVEEAPFGHEMQVLTAFGSIHDARAAVLAWGGDVFVIAPRALRLTVADFAMQTAARYGGVGMASTGEDEA